MEFLGYILKHPLWLLLWLPILFAAYRYLTARKGADTYDISSSEGLPTLSLLDRTTWLPTLLITLAMMSLVFALARPQRVLSKEEVKGEGIDIILAIDISASMLAQDFEPNRLSAAKNVAEEFIRNRAYDRIGLTIYAGAAFTQCPPTTDQNILIDYLRGIHPDMITPGTAIGMGLSTALNRLKDSKAKSKIIILLTDGENNSGYIDPMTAAEMAKELGVRVYTIGVGKNGVVKGVIGKDMMGNYKYGPVRVSIDENTLTTIAEMTGGKYYRAQSLSNLQRIYNEIDTLEKSTVEISVFRKYSELFRLFIWAGIILGLFGFLLKALVYDLIGMSDEI